MLNVSVFGGRLWWTWFDISDLAGTISAVVPPAPPSTSRRSVHVQKSRLPISSKKQEITLALLTRLVQYVSYRGYAGR
jgi:hypothetical protein